jgi:hypothetical protein
MEYSAEERTRILMEHGYLLQVNYKFWMGSVTPYPDDLGVGIRLLPTALPTISVMSKPWVKNVLLQRNAIKTSLSMLFSSSLQFEGGAQRYVLKGAAKAVAESLDASSDKVAKLFAQAADDYKMIQRTARSTLSKNADHIWRTVSHLFKEHPDKQKAPDAWKAMMIERVMDRRFPTEERLRNMTLTYSIYKTQDTIDIIQGKHQRPFPGLLVKGYNLSRLLQGHVPEMRKRLLSRVPNILKTQATAKGLYTLTLGHLSRDFMRIRALNPIPIEGYDIEGMLQEIEKEIASINMEEFRVSKKARLHLAELLTKLLEVYNGEWATKRNKLYLEIFGPTEKE